MRSYQDLVVWQKAMELVRDVYGHTRHWPTEELYGLTSQIRRAAVSVPSNIAEGHGRRSGREFARFLNIAHGSLMEVETQLRIAHDLRFLPARDLECMLNTTAEIGRVLYGLPQSVDTNR